MAIPLSDAKSDEPLPPDHGDALLTARLKATLAAIRAWDRRSVIELHQHLMELKRIVAVFDQDPLWYIRPSDIPTAPLPQLPGDHSVWAIDAQSICLVKSPDAFTFHAHALADVAPRLSHDSTELNSSISGGLRARPPETFSAPRNRRITFQLTEREFEALTVALREDHTPKVATWVRDLVREHLSARNLLVTIRRRPPAPRT